MDPLTQTLLGAAAAQSVFSRTLGRWAFVLGGIGGELPDADVFLSRWADPALPFELHRHFSHALVFIPAGGLLAALPFLLFPRWRKQWGLVIGAATLGCATHALLDNCTSYGTHLLWPFLTERTAWDSMSIIDPIFTLVLLLGALIALIRGRKGARPARAAVAVGMLYIALGFIQHERAMTVQEVLAEQRGHTIERGRVLPTIGNIILWRSLYESDGHLYADAVRIAPFQPPTVRAGTSIPRFTIEDLPAMADPAAGQRVREIFEGLSAFSTGFTGRVAGSTEEVYAIGDVRYSLETGGFQPIWGIEIDPDNPRSPVRWRHFPADREDAIERMWSDVVAPERNYKPVGDAARIRSEDGPG